MGAYLRGEKVDFKKTKYIIHDTVAMSNYVKGLYTTSTTTEFNKWAGILNSPSRIVCKVPLKYIYTIPSSTTVFNAQTELTPVKEALDLSLLSFSDVKVLGEILDGDIYVASVFDNTNDVLSLYLEKDSTYLYINILIDYSKAVGVVGQVLRFVGIFWRLTYNGNTVVLKHPNVGGMVDYFSTNQMKLGEWTEVFDKKTLSLANNITTSAGIEAFVAHEDTTTTETVLTYNQYSGESVCAAVPSDYAGLIFTPADYAYMLFNCVILTTDNLAQLSTGCVTATLKKREVIGYEL